MSDVLITLVAIVVLFFVLNLCVKYGIWVLVLFIVLCFLVAKIISDYQYDKSTRVPLKEKYNDAVQRHYESLIHSSDPKEWRPLNRRLERTVNRKDPSDCMLAVRQLSILDGNWKYYDFNEATSKNGVTWIYSGVTGPGPANTLLEEAVRRHEWIDNCPHGHDVLDIFPLDYSSYGEYCRAVEQKYKSWRVLYSINDCGLDPGEWSTEVEYEQAVQDRIEYLNKYHSYRWSNEKATQSVRMQIDKIDSIWGSLSESLTPQQKAVAVHAQLNEEYVGRDYLQGYISRLKEKCQIEGFFLDEALAKDTISPTAESSEE